MLPLSWLRHGLTHCPNRLVSQRVQCLWMIFTRLYMGQAEDLLSCRWSLIYTDDVEGVSLFSSLTSWYSFRLWPSLVCRQDHRRRSVSDSFRYIFLKRYYTKFGQKFRVWPKELSKRFPKPVISVIMCQQFWSELKILRMEIKNAGTTTSKSNSLRNVNTVWLESRNITTQPVKINYTGQQKKGYKVICLLFHKNDWHFLSAYC